MFLRVPLLALFSLFLGMSLLNLIPIDYWLLEINRNFGSYYLVLHCAMIPLGVLLIVFSDRVQELRVLMSVNLLLIVYYFVPVFPLFFYTGVPEGDLSCDRLYTSMFIQLDAQSQVRPAHELIERLKPDLVLMSASGGLREEAGKLVGSYTAVRRTNGPEYSEITIASVVPLGPTLLEELGSDLPGALIVELPGTRVPRAAIGMVLGVDPLSDAQLAHNSLVMRRSSAALRSLDVPSFTAVSLRMTPHSKLYKVFKEDDAFRDIFSGKGLVRTWSGRSSLIRFHYDQIFAQGTLLTSDLSLVRYEEFNHLPILSALRFCQ